MQADVLTQRPLRPLTERQWRNLLTDIHDGQVAVVAGSELSANGSGPNALTLYQHLARELVRGLDLDESLLPNHYGILAVSNLFLQNPQNDGDDLYREVRDLFNALRWPISEPLLELAAIRDLHLFVTTTFDSLV